MPSPAAPAASRVPKAAAASGLAAFALVVTDVFLRGPLAMRAVPFDAWLAQHVQGIPHVIGQVLSVPGEWYTEVLATCVAGALCWWLGAPRRAVLLVGAAVAVGGLMVVAHHTLPQHNVRFPTSGPDAAWSRPETSTFPIPVEGGATHLFPSGHMVGATFDLGLWFLVARSFADRADARSPGPEPNFRKGATRTWALAWCALLLACALGRLLLRAHWYTDLLAAWTLAVGLLGLVALADTRLQAAAARAKADAMA